MSDKMKNAVNEPQSEEYEYRQFDIEDYPTEIAGPGGRTTNIENNEKGILETIVFRKISLHQKANLGSNHDSYTQGVYGETDGGKYGD